MSPHSWSAPILKPTSPFCGIKAHLKVQAEWGDSDQLDIGDWVLAIGSPLGFDHSVTAGIVSATERSDVRIAEYESFIQTDAAINPGNSGGPLINLAGKVVGINTAIITQTGGYEGIGLAIPASQAKRVVEGLIKQGEVVRGYLGVLIQPLNMAAAQDLKSPAEQPRCPCGPGSARKSGRGLRTEKRRRDRAACRPRGRRSRRTAQPDGEPGRGHQGPAGVLPRWNPPDGDRHHRRASRPARVRDPGLPGSRKPRAARRQGHGARSRTRCEQAAPRFRPACGRE